MNEAAIKMLSTSDLEAMTSGDMSKMSEQGLRVLAGGGQSTAFQRGQSEAGGMARGALSVLNGPLMGFADEIGGAIGATVDAVRGRPGTFGENYRANRDYIRGAQAVEQRDNPIFTGVTQAMASAPLSLLGGGTPVAGVLPATGRAVKTGAIFGGVAGAGNSTADGPAGVALDAAQGAGTGALLGGATTPVVMGMGAGGKNIMARLSETSAGAFAREKLAEAFARDARGNLFTSGQANPAAQAAARLSKLGPDAALVDAGGKNTNQLLDTLATLPGRTKESVFQFQRQRTATAADRLRGAADAALETNGQRLTPTLERLDAQRKAAAAPLYDQLRQTSVAADPDLVSMVQAADKLGALGEARKMATAARQQLTLDLNNPSQWSMQDLDHVKRGLDTLVESNSNAVGKTTAVGRAIDQLRQEFVAKLDDLTVNPQTGQSLYRSARDAYAGPSQLMDAAAKGREAITRDEATIQGLVRGMSDGERDAFRVGAFEGLRAKLGTQSGQTNILNMWKEPATREKLQVIFGDERSFREFAAAASRESIMKRVQSVGNGSQTAARQAGMGDLDVSALTDAAHALTNAKAGNVLGVLGSARNAWGRVATPQSVRDQMGAMLLSQGPRAQQTLAESTALINQINRNNGLLSENLGIGGGLIGGQVGAALPLGLLGR